DALGKWLLATYSVAELLLIRSLSAVLLIAPFLWQAGWRAFRAAPKPGLQIVRVALSTLEVAMFFWAVSYLPLADTVTFYLAGPIYVTALSVVLLREQVGWRRWTAVLVCISLPLKCTAAGGVAPYQYTLVVWAIALGYTVFGDVPAPLTLIGAAIIIGAGLYIFWREQMQARDVAMPTVHP